MSTGTTQPAFILSDGTALVCPDHPQAGVYRPGVWDNGQFWYREIRCARGGTDCPLIWTVPDEDPWPAEIPVRESS
jgi:hypothetical protein